VWEVWERAVGPEVAKRTSPISLRRGTLLVAVATAPWMQQLSFLRENIRDSVNQAMGHALVRDIRFRLGEVERGNPSSGAPPSPPWLAEPIDAATLASIDQEVSAIADPEIREAVRRARVRAEQFRAFKGDREAAPPPESTVRPARGGSREP
jgi:predicted nucleic acid-binding Zn ribbon protein